MLRPRAATSIAAVEEGQPHTLQRASAEGTEMHPESVKRPRRGLLSQRASPTGTSHRRAASQHRQPPSASSHAGTAGPVATEMPLSTHTSQETRRRSSCEEARHRQSTDLMLEKRRGKKIIFFLIIPVDQPSLPRCYRPHRAVSVKFFFSFTSNSRHSPWFRWSQYPQNTMASRKNRLCAPHSPEAAPPHRYLYTQDSPVEPI